MNYGYYKSVVYLQNQLNVNLLANKGNRNPKTCTNIQKNHMSVSVYNYSVSLIIIEYEGTTLTKWHLGTHIQSQMYQIWCLVW